MSPAPARRDVVAITCSVVVVFVASIVALTWEHRARQTSGLTRSAVNGAGGAATEAAFDFGGRPLAIPSGYLESGPPSPFRADVLFLHAYLPGFSIRPARTQPGGYGDEVRILVQTSPTTLNASYARRAAGRADGSLDERFGLKAFSTVPGRGGTLGGPNTKMDQVLFRHDGREVTTLIVCTPGYPSPPCAQEFRAFGLGFQATYGMAHLAQWREIEDGIRDMMRRFGAR